MCARSVGACPPPSRRSTNSAGARCRAHDRRLVDQHLHLLARGALPGDGYAIPSRPSPMRCAGAGDDRQSPPLPGQLPDRVRAAAADDLMLSTAAGRESGYIAVHRYARTIRRIRRLISPPTWSDHDRAPAPVGRWGKMHPRCRLPAHRVPRFDRFVAVRDQFDPDRVFCQRLPGPGLGPDPSAASEHGGPLSVRAARPSARSSLSQAAFMASSRSCGAASRARRRSEPSCNCCRVSGVTGDLRGPRLCVRRARRSG